jgi:hypothetical protein
MRWQLLARIILRSLPRRKIGSPPDLRRAVRVDDLAKPHAALGDRDHRRGRCSAFNHEWPAANHFQTHCTLRRGASCQRRFQLDSDRPRATLPIDMSGKPVLQPRRLRARPDIGERATPSVGEKNASSVSHLLSNSGKRICCVHSQRAILRSTDHRERQHRQLRRPPETNQLPSPQMPKPTRIQQDSPS